MITINLTENIIKKNNFLSFARNMNTFAFGFLGEVFLAAFGVGFGFWVAGKGAMDGASTKLTVSEREAKSLG